MPNFSKENLNYFCGFQTSDKYVKLFTNDQIVHKFHKLCSDHGAVPVLALLHAAVVPHWPRGSHPRCPLGPRQGHRLPRELDNAAAALHPGSELRSPPRRMDVQRLHTIFSTTFPILDI
jgi:hypothetical protein